MKAVIYLYLPTPEHERVQSIFVAIEEAGVVATHYGLNDPPKKWSGSSQEMATQLLSAQELNKHAFLRDKNKNIDVGVSLFFDPRWSCSEISATCPDQAGANRIAVALSTRLDPYLCIQGSSGGGKTQSWLVLHEHEDCPDDIKSKIVRA